MPTNLNEYGISYIGSGPISVIDALCTAARDERSVLIIDEKKQLGGAWVAIEVAEYGRLEIGCHIWSYNRKAYDFIKSFFELELITLTPSPQIINGNKTLAYDYKMVVLTLKRLASDLFRFKLKSLTHFVQKNPSARLPLIPKSYLYPKGGARAFQHALINAVEKSSVQVALNHKVIALRKVDQLWELKTETGNLYYSKAVKLTATSAVKRIEANGKQLEIQHRNVTYSHFHLVIDQQLKKPLSYVRVMDDHLIHRITDITYQLEFAKNSAHTVLLIGVFYDKKGDDAAEADLVQHILTYLKKQNWLTASAQLVYSQLNHFETTYIPADQLKSIEALDETVEVIASTDLIYGIHSKLKDWTR